MISFMTETIMRTLWIIFLYLSQLLLLLIFKYFLSSDILSYKPQIWKPRNMGLQLEFVENENLTEIHILMTEFNSSFTSLITVDMVDCQPIIFCLSPIKLIVNC